LGDELRLLDEAHAALSAGDTSRALALLDRHDREATKPALAPEALALRVEVYARQGDRASVTRAANQFLALYGDRPEAQRVRTILEANP
jgi:outer membrane protein assembly factor BamD (BamD/ComL family)